MTSRRLLQRGLLFQAIIVVLLVALAAWQIDLGGLGRAFADTNYWWLALAFAIYLVSRAVHAVEWQITLSKVGEAPLLGLLGALLIGTLVNAVVPASAGDVVKIQVVANRYGLPRAGLVAGRGAEAIVNALIMVIFIIVSLALPGVGFASRNLAWLAAAAAAAVFVTAVLASRLLPAQFPEWRALSHLPRWARRQAERHWPRVYEGFEAIRRPRLLTVNVLLNLFGWGVDLAIFWAYGRAFHLQLPLAAYLSVTVIVAILTTFPITFGNVGTYEVAVLSILSLYSVPAHEALAFAAGTHVVSSVFNIGLGVCAMWAMGVRPGEVFRLGGSRADRQPERT